MVTSAELSSGTLSRWDDERGFGFITPVSDRKTVFVHISAFSRELRRPVVGDTITYRIETTSEGKTRAADVSYIGASSASAQPHRRGSRPWSGSYLIIVAFVALVAGVVIVWQAPLWIPAVYTVASLACYAAYAADKVAARTGGWRVSEGSLLLLGLIGGWPGAMVAQQTLRHKTVKQSFRFLFWITVLVNISALLYFSAPGMVDRFLEQLV